MYQRIGHYKTGFKYIDSNTKKEVTDEDVLKWIKELRIPPAYNDVIISHNKNSKILAYGYDSKMRKQVIYHSKFVELQQEKKYEKVMRLHQVFQAILAKVMDDLHSKDIRTKEIAIIIYLIINCGFRIGNKKYELQNQSYGISTIKFKHVGFQKGCIIFDFIGKKGVQNVSSCDNHIIYKYLLNKKKTAEGLDANVFTNISSQDVNNYLKQFDGDGDDMISSKDLRTWNANMLFLKYVKEEIDKGTKKPIQEALKRVSDKLHNTSVVCKKSYIDPNIIKIIEEKIKNDYI